ncbi:sulfotransferase 4A1-like [Liolophura sinensis]|uniref:sulfotransferase 4A1-like n=1 Tax=Liolophura sinensis TaxID=3198878 RepID=UPI00315959AF
MATKKFFCDGISGFCKKTIPKSFLQSSTVLNGQRKSQFSDVTLFKSAFLRSTNRHGNGGMLSTKSGNFYPYNTFATKTDRIELGRGLLALGRKNRLTCLSENSFPIRLDIFSTSERRYISEGQGFVFPRKQKWWCYFGGVVLVLGVGAWALFQYKKISLQSRGVSLFYIPHLPFQVMYPFGSYKGIAINTTMLNSLEQVENFEVRKDDIFVVSFPRSGTTWTQELVYMVANDADVEKASSMNLEARFPYLEDHENSPENLKTAESPRFIKSHLPYRLLPKEIETKKPKIIYVMRNPKDMVVSFYHLWLKLRARYRGQFSDFCELFLQDNLMFSPWTEHVKEFWERRDEDNILFLKYEDLHMNLSHEVERISKFLNKPLTPEQVVTIVDHCSFDSMKKNDKVNYRWWDERGITANIGTSFIRKGRVGDWKNFFTPELDQRMSEKVERPLANMGIEVKYE